LIEDARRHGRSAKDGVQPGRNSAVAQASVGAASRVIGEQWDDDHGVLAEVYGPQVGASDSAVEAAIDSGRERTALDRQRTVSTDSVVGRFLFR
jgi:hypothetical protein